MFLSILIPTYKRADFLINNLLLLSDFISRGGYSEIVEIVISNNDSPDQTDVLVKDFVSQHQQIKLQYYKQENNIGLEKNALFTLEKAQGEYVMFLGDDDYLVYEYFCGVITHLQGNKQTHCVIPNFVPIDMKGNILGTGRDDRFPTKLHSKGFKNCLINSYRGHQLSGLVFKREGLLQSYKERKVNNIYPFIYFVAYSCLQGNTYLFTDYPVRVTQPGQQNKDWGYGKDGLLNEIFDNYKKLPTLSQFQKTRLQLKMIKEQLWRVTIYKQKGMRTFIKSFCNIWFAKNATAMFVCLFPFYFVLVYISKR